jgi:6-phosphogluconolactonase
LRLIVGADAAEAARFAADEIAHACREAVTARGCALVALSGGETPWLMMEHLRTLPLDWPRVHVVQVDERLAPAGDPRRNLTRLAALLVRDGPLAAANLHALPVESTAPDSAAAEFQLGLEAAFGRPLRLDIVQLGLGTDGHTASLVPGDAVLQVTDRDVAVTAGTYQGLQRMTLTFPALNRARRRLWLVTGASKAPPLAALLAGTSDAPAAQVSPSAAVVVTDAAAAG